MSRCVKSSAKVSRSFHVRSFRVYEWSFIMVLRGTSHGKVDNCVHSSDPLLPQTGCCDPQIRASQSFRLQHGPLWPWTDGVADISSLRSWCLLWLCSVRKLTNVRFNSIDSYSSSKFVVFRNRLTLTWHSKHDFLQRGSPNGFPPVYSEAKPPWSGLPRKNVVCERRTLFLLKLVNSRYASTQDSVVP